LSRKVLIIGAGIGGLAAGVRLASKGYLDYLELIKVA
jgi:phytoene dehydrogenase-like protein